MTFALRLVAALALISPSVLAGNVHVRETYEAAFYDHCAEYGLSWSTGAEYVARLQLFADASDMIEAHNAKPNVTYKLGHNKYSTLTRDEFGALKGIAGGAPKRAPAARVHSASDASGLPDAVDWTTDGAVTAVKDQGSCGSCWSFSATGCMEGAYFLKYGELVSFSEQNIVDCDVDGDDQGCSGGLMDGAFEFAMANGGLCSEGDYAYTGTDGTCSSSSCTVVPHSTPANYTDVQVDSASSLMSAVAQQPVSIAIEADQAVFQYYASGVITGSCGTTLDHGVLAVGYGTFVDGTDYWKVKNSWGASWGMDGYVLLERGSSQDGGMCGILADPSYVNF